MSFSSFNFSSHISKAIEKCGYHSPTPIQQKAIGPILERRDLLGLAQTGTGKTAAFMLPTIQHLMGKPEKHIRTLIVAPTRELAEQINDFTREITQNTHLRSIAIYGGVSKNVQIAKIRKGVDIVVACPGRLLDILRDGEINLMQVETLILDEADHMFDHGFLPDIRRILKKLPYKRQSLVFSATMPKEIRHLAEDVLYNPVTVQINHTKAVQKITHSRYDIEQQKKTKLLVHLLKQNSMTTALVFTRTKYKAKNVAKKLMNSGFKATSLQGNLSQNRRQQALAGFKDGTFNILVATDIAARGIDVTGISHVINFDVPDTTEAYIHRTGRTGRASSSGEAITFVTKDDTKIIRLVERSLQKKMQSKEVSLPHTEKRAETFASTGARKKRTNKKGKRYSKGSETTGIFGITASCKN